MLYWHNRELGDDITNPRPSFMPREGNEFIDLYKGAAIVDIASFQNRLVVLTKDSIVLSSVGLLTNFWYASQEQITPLDPIDIFLDNESNARSIWINGNSIYVFCDNEIFRVYSTDQETWTPGTVKKDKAGEIVSDLSLGVHRLGFLAITQQLNGLPMGVTVVEGGRLVDGNLCHNVPDLVLPTGPNVSGRW